MVVWALFRANIFVRVLFRGLFWATFAWALFGALFGEGFRDFRDYETFMLSWQFRRQLLDVQKTLSSLAEFPCLPFLIPFQEQVRDPGLHKGLNHLLLMVGPARHKGRKATRHTTKTPVLISFSQGHSTICGRFLQLNSLLKVLQGHSQWWQFGIPRYVKIQLTCISPLLVNLYFLTWQLPNQGKSETTFMMELVVMLSRIGNRWSGA